MTLCTEQLNLKESIKRVLICGISWILGYGIMWGSKWIIATIVIGKDVIANAIEAIVYRTSDSTIYTGQFSRIDAIKNAISVYDVSVTRHVFLANAIILLIAFIFNIKKYHLKTFTKNIIDSIPMLATGLMTIVWYVTLSNHTFVHPFLSFRTAVVLWMAILMFGYKIVFGGIENEKI